MGLPSTGRWRVTGQAGSGVTSLLVDTVVEKLRSGASPDGILVVTASKESGARLRGQLHDRLLALDSDESTDTYVSSAPLVRSVHSVAFALLRQVHEEHIRLITGAEQDGVIRELLAGHAEDSRGGWPEEVRPALTFVGFARQLRDLLLRAVERGVGPDELEELGNRHGRPLWSAAGRFLREYEQTMALTGTHNYSASELTATVLDRELSADWHTVIVDDAQHLDPKAGELITRILPTGPEGLAVVGGDLEQSVFHFRGATPEFFTGFDPDDGCDLDLGESRRQPATRVAVTDSETTDTSVVADAVRRAHLEADIPWSDIAVIVRSTGQIQSVRRALLAAGVPVHLNPTDFVLGEQHLVAAILLGIRALDEELAPSELEKLILGPVGGADPVTLRRLLRGLRRHDPDSRGMDTLAGLLLPGAELPDFSDTLTQRELDILTRLRAVLEAGRSARAADGSVEEVLWAVWQATGLSDRLLAAALRGGATGSQADRDLDAMMALFDAAGDFVERHPGTGSVDTFVDHIRDQELPTGVRDRRSATPDAVALLTAHGAVGHEYRAVVVAGVQEGTWPTLGETGSLFGQEDLLDLLDRGIDPDAPVSHAASRLKEERRLFHVATTRATEQLLVTAVDNLEAKEPVEPSRFIEEFANRHQLEVEEISGEPAALGDERGYAPGVRILSRTSLVAELRRAVSDPDSRDDVRRQAARQLARLAEAGVPGADPGEWWATTSPSTSTALEVRPNLSPSRIEGLKSCPLRAVMGRIDDDSETPIAMVKGTLAHAYFEAIGRGVDEEYARLSTVAALRSVMREPEWRTESAAAKFTSLLERSNAWLLSSRSAYTQRGVEVDVKVEIIDGVSIVGRIDRLEEDEAGAAYVIDLKTGGSAVTKDQARENQQLKAYQLALSRGKIDGDAVRTADDPADALTVGGATLVFPGHPTKSIATRDQTRLDDEELDAFAAELPGLLEAMTGPNLLARENPDCPRCPIRTLCPIQPEGKAVTHAA